MKLPLIMTSNFDSLDVVAATILIHAQKARIFTLTGMLGAGKTTLVKSFLSQYGICPSEVTSPTFTYCNIYRDCAGRMYYHFDLYRIQSLEAFCDLGFHEYLCDSAGVVFVEWPSVIMALLNDNVCRIDIEYANEVDQRILTVEID